jgi:murein DD-endopeptidase MepM/ murein hydrolase activator NlpD
MTPTPMWRTTKKRLLVLAMMIAMTLGLSSGQPLFADTVDELSKKIEAQKKSIEELQKNITKYQNDIKQKQGEAKSLKNQLAILENQVAEVQLDIQATEARIEQTNLEIQQLNLQITEQEKSIDGQKVRMGEYVRLLNRNDQVTYMEVMLTRPSFAEFFDQLKYTQQIYSSLNETLEKLKLSKQQLEVQKTNWEDKIKQEEELKTQLQQKRSQLAERSTAKGVILAQTQLTAKQYQSTLQQLQAEQAQTNAEIVTLEKRVRAELEKRKNEDLNKLLGPAVLSWPVDPSRGITTTFHDADYPFRYIFEHPGIDIRAAQGTTIKAPAAGYVGQVKFKGDSSYAYIMLIHSDGLSTVYGHISKPLVKVDQYVAKGDPIALSGALPKSVGAGPFTTGPHLHLEVRKNGIPVNPLKYLP